MKKRETIINKIERKILYPSRFIEINARNFKKIVTADTLKFMSEQIDLEFFDNKLFKTFENMGCCLSFCFGNTCGSLAGQCSYRTDGSNKMLTIKMMPNIFIKSFKDAEIKLRAVNKVKCENILSCFLMVLCHELVHAIIFCNCIEFDKTDKGPGNWSGTTRPGNGHSKTFMSILNNRYGHKAFSHSLKYGITTEILNKKVDFGSHNLKKGNRVIIEVKSPAGKLEEKEVTVISAGKVYLKVSLVENPQIVYRGRFYAYVLRRAGEPKPKNTPELPPPPKTTPVKQKTPIPQKPKTPTPQKPKTPTPVKPKTPPPQIKSNWSNKYPNKFLKGLASKKRYNTLEAAKIDGDKMDIGGITKYGKINKYTLRKGSELMDSKSGEISWLKTKKNNNTNNPNNKPIIFKKKIIIKKKTQKLEVKSNNNVIPLKKENPKLLTKRRIRKKIIEPVISDELLSKFSIAHDNKYIKGYVTKDPIKFNTLKEAMENAIKTVNSTGITMNRNKKYTSRKGTELLDSKTNEKSWLKVV